MSHPPKRRAMDQKHSDNWSSPVEVPSTEKTLAQKFILFLRKNKDVTFLVGDDKVEIQESSQILSALSPVFEVMFSEQWTDKSKPVPLPDIEPKVFSVFLNLMVTNDLKIRDIQNFKLPIDKLLHLLYIVKKYDVESIERCCKELVKSSMTIQNAASIFEALEFLDEVRLQQEAFNFIEKIADSIFKAKELPATSREFLVKLLKSDKLKIDEIDVFRAMRRWAEAALTEKGEEVFGRKIREAASGKNVREVLGDLFWLIRFPLISSRDLVVDVKPTGMLTDAEYIGLLEYNTLAGSKESQSMLKDMYFNTTPRILSRPPQVTAITEVDDWDTPVVATVTPTSLRMGGSNFREPSWWH